MAESQVLLQIAPRVSPRRPAREDQIDAIRRIYFLAARIRDRAANRSGGWDSPSESDAADILEQIAEASRSTR